MDVYDKVSTGISKYIFPVLFFIIGLAGIIIGVTVNPETGVKQTAWFVNGGIVLTVMGLLMGLHIAGMFKRKLGMVLIPFLLGIGIWFIFMNYMSVKRTMDLKDKKEAYNEYVKQSLLDIRDIQVAFRKTYGIYSADRGQLEEFLKNGTVSYITNRCDERQIPDGRMTLEQADSLGIDPNTDEGNRAMERIDEDEAVRLGLITRDTIQVPAMDYIFNGYKICECEAKDKEGNPTGKMYDVTISPMSNQADRTRPFNPAEMWSKPHSDEKLIVDAKDIGDTALANPVFVAFDPTPLDPFNAYDTLQVGSLKKHMTEGNWRD